MKTSPKKMNVRMAMLFLSFLTMSFTACSDNDEIPDQQMSDKTITEIVVESDDFSLLESAVVHAGLTEALGGTDPLTVFAPDNDAFIAAGLDTEEKIMALDKETLKSILLYHVISGKQVASGIQEGSNNELATLAEKDVFITKAGSNVSLNGGAVIQPDVMAKNGIIHVINKVLMPPMGNLVEALQGDENMTFLVAAVLKASQGSTNVAEVLTGDGPFTVFAPTNMAFQAAGFADINAVSAADPNTLASILTYHVVPTRVFSTNLAEGVTPETLAEKTVTITLEGGAKVKGTSNETAANITAADKVATNGVIHVIDQVLLP